MRRKLWPLSYLLIALGIVLLFLGARDFFESRIGQQQASRDFERSTTPATPDSQGSPAPIPTGEAFAKLSIPRLGAEFFVVEGDGARELRRGPGHLTGTAMPGQLGNCVIAGHRDTHFRVLKDVRKGDDLVLQTSQGQFLYRIKSLTVVTPDNTHSLQPTPTAVLNLITCYPFYYVGSAPKRFVVEAQLSGSVASTKDAHRYRPTS